MPICYANTAPRLDESEKPLILLVNMKMVPATGLEPVQCYLLEPESSASANSATRATNKINICCGLFTFTFSGAPRHCTRRF